MTEQSFPRRAPRNFPRIRYPHHSIRLIESLIIDNASIASYIYLALLSTPLDTCKVKTGLATVTSQYPNPIS